MNCPTCGSGLKGSGKIRFCPSCKQHVKYISFEKKGGNTVLCFKYAGESITVSLKKHTEECEQKLASHHNAYKSQFSRSGIGVYMIDDELSEAAISIIERDFKVGTTVGIRRVLKKSGFTTKEIKVKGLLKQKKKGVLYYGFEVSSQKVMKYPTQTRISNIEKVREYKVTMEGASEALEDAGYTISRLYLTDVEWRHGQSSEKKWIMYVWKGTVIDNL